MALTLQELERRLAAVEAELARLRPPTNDVSRELQSPQPPAARGPGDEPSILTDPLDVVMDEMRRRGVPLTVEELRAMQAKDQRRRTAERTKGTRRSAGRSSRRRAGAKRDE
jgi:hypothetical protein